MMKLLSYTINLFQAPDARSAAASGQIGLRHLAFLVDSEAHFKAAWRRFPK